MKKEYYIILKVESGELMINCRSMIKGIERFIAQGAQVIGYKWA